MPTIVSCACGKQYRADDSLAGRTVKCRSCGRAIEIPAPFNVVAVYPIAIAKNAPQREDIATWFDWLELDDFVTFGGKP